MRHKLHTDVTIEATPEKVWEVLIDLDRYSGWNPFIVEASGEVTLGDRISVRMQAPGGRAMTLKPVVTAVEQARTFEWVGHLVVRGLFDARHRFDLTATSSGATHLSHTEYFEGILVRIMRKALDTQTRSGFEAMNSAIKTQVEATMGAAS